MLMRSQCIHCRKCRSLYNTFLCFYTAGMNLVIAGMTFVLYSAKTIEEQESVNLESKLCSNLVFH